ncbi:MAG: RNA polymerase sigma factor [Candidatus Cybelea sp.]
MEALLAAWWPEAYRIAYGILRDRSYAQDAAQDACAIIYQRLKTLRSIGSHRAWLYRIVVRCAKTTARTQPQLGASAERSLARPTSGLAIDEALDLDKALEELPPAMRTLVFLRYYADLTSREIGTVMGIPSATVRFRLAIARNRLKRILENQPSRFASSIDEVRSHV